MDRLGLGYSVLKELNPRLIYCAISGFGRTGPWSEQGGYDLIAQGMSGLMSITGEGPGRPPVKIGSPACDITAGIIGAMGVCAAYAHKLRTGEGQFVDTSLYEAGITLTYWQSAIALATGVSPGPMGSAHPLNTPYQAFETKDGWMNVGASNAKMYPMLCRILGCPELATDPRFAKGEDRMRRLAEFIAEIAPHFRRKTTAEWLAQLEKAGIPSGPVLSIKDMLAHPQTRAREMVAARPSACRSSSRRHPVGCCTPRPSSASTRARCWPSTASAGPRSRRWWRRVRRSCRRRASRSRAAGAASGQLDCCSSCARLGVRPCAGVRGVLCRRP
jgi:crotonobetainyl-CoA:carnitine CoA-transferase CaiB-like acyl-CoA transferase